jgi:hypothetical protein
MRFILKSAVAAAMGFVLFGLMQVLFGSAHCFDCGARVGFPFSYMQEGTYATHGHIIWRGLAADCAVALGFGTMAIWVLWRGAHCWHVGVHVKVTVDKSPLNE